MDLSRRIIYLSGAKELLINKSEDNDMSEKKKNMLKKFLMLPAAVFCGVAVFTGAGAVYASDSPFDDIPEDAASYTLVWPDGSDETFTDRQEAINAYENEKLLGTYTTDEEGLISLKGYAGEGSVRLYEAVVPEGYTAAEQSTKAELSEGSITVINRRNVTPPDDKKDGDHGDDGPAEGYPSGSGPAGGNSSGNSPDQIPGGAPDTGDSDPTAMWAGIAAAAGFTALAAVLIRKKKAGVLALFISAGAVGFGTFAYAGANADAAENETATDRKETGESDKYTNTFTLHKTDENGTAVKGAVFEVYGNPTEVTWEPAPDVQTSDIVILYTNDVHCGIDTNVGYAGVEAYRKEMEAAGYTVILVDSGDAVQGESIGILSKGESIMDIMNALDYDVVTPGNHEFDYGMDQFFSLVGKAQFPYVSCNFTDLRTGGLVFEPYKIIEAAGRKIAFVGATTPKTITESAPYRFEDKDGNIIYGFKEGADGQNLYNAIQSAVDSARAEGADYCVLLSHLGVNAADVPYTSSDVINHTTGIDAVLDGHSHTVIEMEKVKNAAGHDVVLTQDGYQIPYIAKVTIDRAGNIKSEFISDYDKKDKDIAAIVEQKKEEFEQILKENVGTTDFALPAKDESGAWLVRNGETNLGDFYADAFRYAADAEIGFINGGGLRTDIPAGTIRYGNIMDVSPFGNFIFAKNVTGQELADALEFSVSAFPNFFGGFLQVSGVTFDVDVSIESPVITDDAGNFVRVGDGPRRVSNIVVNGVPLDLERVYKCASIDFIIANEGNGYTMFKGDLVKMDENIVDADAVKEYLLSLGGVMPADYSDPEGQGRINMKE